MRGKMRDGQDATYQVLYDALDHKLQLVKENVWRKKFAAIDKELLARVHRIKVQYTLMCEPIYFSIFRLLC